MKNKPTKSFELPKPQEIRCTKITNYAVLQQLCTSSKSPISNNKFLYYYGAHDVVIGAKSGRVVQELGKEL